MKIIVDGYGGDNAPQAVVEGAARALSLDKSLEVVLCGNEAELKQLFSACGGDAGRVTFLNSTQIITNDDAPTAEIRAKADSSLVRGLELLSSDDSCGGFVSAGSTGAVLAGAFMKVGRIKHISRPALAPVLPAYAGSGKVVLVDCGANVDCKPVNLLHFALMGVAFAEAQGIKNPRVGLLNNGTEAKKGNELTKESYELLSNGDFEFAGNIEGRDLLSGDVDVVVSDGFNGNIALKTAEGVSITLFSLIKDAIKEGGLRTKLGALLLKPALKKVKAKLDYNEYGGACFLGVKKVIIKAHGASKASSVSAAILQAKELVEAGMVGRIEEGVAKLSTADGPSN